MIRRVEKAKCLLLDPFENVSDIAGRCGFSDPAYFARVFRKIAGRSPREYRDDPRDMAQPADATAQTRINSLTLARQEWGAIA